MADGSSVSFESLPATPMKPEEFAVWKAWAADRVQERRWPQTAHATAWRAILSDWAGLSVDPQQACRVASQFLTKALQAPAYVVRAADKLVQICMEGGATTPDVLYLTAAFAWPLRDLYPERSEAAWEYLVHAPWQTEAMTLITLAKLVNESRALRPDRTLNDLAHRRIDARLRNSALEVLEAIALVQADCDSVDQIPDKGLDRKPALEDSEPGIVKLAQMYREDGETGIHARTVLGRAAQIDPKNSGLRDCLNQTVWDRPFEECFQWSKKITRPQELNDELKRILAVEQPHHARRLAETVIVRRFNDSYVGEAEKNLSGAIEKFGAARDPDILTNHLARQAAEHLAVLYIRTNFATKEARAFVHRVATSIPFTGSGAPLHALKPELELFVNTNDPYVLLREEEKRMADQEHKRSDGERRVGNDLNAWFQSRWGGNSMSMVDRMIGAIAAPLSDVAKKFPSLPGLEATCAAAFRMMVQKGSLLAGDLSALYAEGATIRQREGISPDLLVRARSLRWRGGATAVAMTMSVATSLLPAGMSFVASGLDLGVTLVATYAGVARIAALFGVDLSSPEGFRLVADSFSLGCSSDAQEGVVSYLSHNKERVVSAISLGGVSYGSHALAGYLWATHKQPQLLAEQGIRHLARLCAIGLSKGGMAKLIPIAGAVISVASTAVFMQRILDAAVHLAARKALLKRLPEEA